MKSIAFYLPQFHPIPENDEWWGVGFSEWRNVARARPWFPGHHQPQIPADLGFYDLRLQETRIAQAELARRYGVGGFCYYHYWFNGSLLLEKPLEAVVAEGVPDFPFCVCWANESWGRNWDGKERTLLMPQNLEQYDPDTHFEYLGKFFADPRYIRVDDKPLFAIYRIDQFPDIRQTIAQWRAKAESMGLPGIYLCAVRSHMHKMSIADTIDLGFDAVVGFEPHALTLSSQRVRSVGRKLLPRLFNLFKLRDFVVHDYKTAVDAAVAEPVSSHTFFPCATPSWDNSSRRKTAAMILQNDDANEFERWLRDGVRRVADYDDDEQIVFINAWNEWAEGCHLEPDLRNGHRFLEAVRNVFGTNAEAPNQARRSN